VSSVLKSYESASPADASRWKLVHDVTYDVDRKHFWHVVRNERILSMLEKAVPNLKGVSYLEIGCGVANVLGFLVDQGLKDCTGWDINRYSLELARNRYPNTHFAERDFLLPAREHEKFDVLGMFDVLEHFEDDVSVLRSAWALLRPGGTVILTVPAHNFLWSDYDDFFGHHRRYEKSQLAKVMTAAGFSDLKLVYMMAALCPAILASRKRLIRRKLNDAQLEDLFERESRLPIPILNGMAMTILRIEHKLLGDRDLGFGAALVATGKSL
jgi:2-polyprenyl-3-methyl-5-hydroxy-6-metoxy-1,4-benzoquinol methylase